MKLYSIIPEQRPNTPLLDSIDSPIDLKQLTVDQLPLLADQLREFLLYSVGQSGGHFGSGLGVVELTIALHYVFDSPNDKICWDVGHQAYPHKILTGRREQLLNIRSKEGLSAFPKRSESKHDAFGVGHSSTSISAAMGYACAHRLQNLPYHSVAVIGDGALTAGMAFEALSHAGADKTPMLVVLNDNDMSISESVGGVSNALTKIISSKTFLNFRENSKKVLSNLPHAMSIARKAEEHVKGMISPSTLFEELGFNYIGPVDGHNIYDLVRVLSNIKDNISRYSGPQFLHIRTQKGKGFEQAEDSPIAYHAISKIQKNAKPVAPIVKAKTYSNIFGQWLVQKAQQDERIVGITPAMREGSDMVEFSKKFPKRYFDVAIAEQHAVTFAAGLACQGLKPVVAIYSTFLQRAYDQLIHDVAIQNLDVLFAIDRSGIVGEDGATHAGNLDISFIRCVPNMILMTPKDENECAQMLELGYQYNGPAAVRYPRGKGPGVAVDNKSIDYKIGEAELIKQGEKIALLAFGSMVEPAKECAEQLNATLVNMRFIKPLDTTMLDNIAKDYDYIVTLEENVVMGGAGSAINEYLHSQKHKKSVLNLGLPDYYQAHGTPAQLIQEARLDTKSIIEQINAFTQ
ncbi:MAG: 1-deoxy-D-xylulose-5-phosphate synthase [Saccharospirillaceae bacterium]|nr:1-deoxy-D-xylulose-5-phosphate synthase [Pseudomonadales bacterium]NRB78128.1 1-deoxy-D-xylulose-5-phosphate synthase [Saccharospirillaceae bacterium]